jgi:hypothetical protein
LNPEIRAQQFKWAQPTKVEAKPSDPALGFGAEAKPFENPVLTTTQPFSAVILTFPPSLEKTEANT